MYTKLCAAAIMTLLAGNSLAINIASVSSGDWNNPNTWFPAVVPGPNDIVTISPGDTVYTASAGVPASPLIGVDQLTIYGTLISDDTPGFGNDLFLAINALDVRPGGAIITQDGTGNSPGGSLWIRGNTTLSVTVDGSIGLGSGQLPGTFSPDSGTGGGCLLVSGTDAQGSSIPGATWNSSGIVQAGINGGRISMSGLANIWVFDGMIAAGDATNGAPGSVWMESDQSLDILGPAVVRSGEAPYLAMGRFGAVVAGCTGTLTVGSGATVDGRTFGCVFLFAGGTSTINGLVNSPCVSWEPPSLELSGAGKLAGDAIQLSGSHVRIGPLAGPKAIDALGTIDVLVNPGGTLDLRGLAAGKNWLRAGQSITIRADSILTDPGVTLGQLMSPAPAVLAGSGTRELLIMNDSVPDYNIMPGRLLHVVSDVLNFGSAAEPVQVSVSDSKGWLSGQSASRTLGVGEPLTQVLDVAAPADAMPAEYTTVTVTARALGSPPFERTAEFTVRVVRSCPADFDQSWFVDLEDYTAFIAAFEAGDESADFDASHFTDLDDFAAFVEAFIRGC